MNQIGNLNRQHSFAHGPCPVWPFDFYFPFRKPIISYKLILTSHCPRNKNTRTNTNHKANEEKYAFRARNFNPNHFESFWISLFHGSIYFLRQMHHQLLQCLLISLCAFTKFAKKKKCRLTHTHSHIPNFMRSESERKKWIWKKKEKSKI